MKAKELKEKNIEELKKMLKENQEKVRQLRFDISSKQVKDHREYRNLKRDIAKIMTALNGQKK